MPFLDHLEELRWRLIWSLAAALVGSIVGFVIVHRFRVLDVLIDPLTPYLEGRKVIALSPTDAFFVTLKVGIILGLILAAPIIIYQIWAFLSPALRPEEKRAIVPALYFGLVLFAGGVTMAYYAVLPVTLRFLLGFQTETIEPMITVTAHLSFVVRLLMAFGLVFELPIVILLLSVLGVVTPQFLAEKRRYAIAGIAILSSVLTPGDVITVTVMMMVPLIGLYEVGILLSKMVTRKRLQAAAAQG
jgi:sec-independent protein translocase protein TatC